MSKEQVTKLKSLSSQQHNHYDEMLEHLRARYSKFNYDLSMTSMDMECQKLLVDTMAKVELLLYFIQHMLVSTGLICFPS